MRNPTLRARVVVGVLAVVMVALAASGYTAVAAFRGYLLGQADSELREVLTTYAPKVNKLIAMGQATGGLSGLGTTADKPSLGKIQVGIPAIVDNYYLGFTPNASVDGRTTAIVDGNADLVPRLPGDLTTLASIDATTTVSSANGNAQLRLVAMRIGTAGTLTATMSLAPTDSAVARLQRIIVAVTLTVALVVVVGVGLAVRRGLRPVESMAAAAGRITAGDLTTRVAPEDPATEMGSLGAALNGMLDRIEVAVRERRESEEATRRFFADASHELRTPLASLRANAELYQQGALRGGPQLDEAMRRITSEARRMSTLVDDMLRLARLDTRPEDDHEPVDLTALIRASGDRARSADPDRTFQVRADPCLLVMGDPELLRRAVDNLLANVTAHTPPGTTATVTGLAANGEVMVEVSDDGPGVRADHIDRIFDRFHRVPSATRRAGSGLGLAIAAAAAASHDGSVRASPCDPHGLRVTLTLPGERAG